MGKLLGAMFAFAALASAPVVLTACATGHITYDGGGGSAGSTSSGGTTSQGGTGGTTATTTTTTTTKTDGTCVGAEDCAALTDACNTGACINGMCGTLPSSDGAACEDGKQCTQNDTCYQGKCVGGALKSCASSNPCMVGICDVASDSCKEQPGNDGAFCNLQNSCIQQAKCLSGVCQPSQMTDCSFLNSDCADGVCDPNVGCKAIPKADGSACNDFKFCTVNDQCVQGACKGQPNMCGQPNNPCYIAVCNEAQQTCVAQPGNNGAACDDGNLCTGGETCSNGQCTGGVAANNGTMCDDGNGCTGGTTCSNGICGNPQSQIQQCVNGDQCCPAGCAGDTDCLWYVSGVQQNIPEAQLTGWQQCYKGLYADFSPSMSQILSQCSKSKLLLGCRQVGQTTFHTLAMGPRVDVIFDTGTGNTPHDANGVGWYYNDSYSWGFAPQGEPITRNSCDTTNTGNENRLCWHTGGGSINGGWRCGAATGLNGDTTWERIVYQAD